MASKNRHSGSKDNFTAHGSSDPTTIAMKCDENEASGEIKEDDILYQMDQELDQRLSYLCGLRTQQAPANMARSTDTNAVLKSFPQGFDGQQENFVHETCERLSNLSVCNTYSEDQSLATGNSKRNVMVKRNNSIRNNEDQECTQGSKGEGFSPHYLDSELPKSSSSHRKQDQLNEIHKSEENFEAKAELLKDETEENELDDAKTEGIFDEFLDHSTRIRIATLTKRAATLNEALKLTQEECKRLSQSMRSACTAAQVAERERRNMNKQVQTLQQELSKLQKVNKHSQQRVKDLTRECQSLRKELSSTRQSECERRNAQSSCEAQLTRSRADNAALRDQMANLVMRHKEETNQLHASIESSNSRFKETERWQRNVFALVQKQEKLIAVLNEQKNNVAAAKAVAGLEEKFLDIISPLQAP